MEFESPDVEKDFPGLYASESGKRSNESDFSDDAHDRPSKKDLLIGKRKDKKDSKKDRGYAALEGESSPEEDPEIKSPSKSKKSKSFKFPSTSKKEKREKSREKDGKEKEREADKEKKRDKDGKVKLRLKERKKSKHGEDSIDIEDEHTVFGIPLQLAVKRSRCHDGVDIPLVIRNSIDYIEEHGLKTESIYKISGIKSKVQYLRRLYNQREPVKLADYDIPAVTSLLKQFFRELPEPLLTTELLPRFEEAAAVKDVLEREIELGKIVQQLPECNRQLLSWLLIHLDNITQNDKFNKMNAQNISITLSPVLQMSHRLFTALLCHCKALFPNITLAKYIPPLSSGSPSLPDTGQGITEELRKQESLLSQIHQEMNDGFVSKQKEEQLWEVQRIITQLKRKLRSVQRSRDSHQNQKSLDEDRTDHKSFEEEFRIDLTLQKAHSCSEEDATAVNSVQPLPINQVNIGLSPSEIKQPTASLPPCPIEDSFDQTEDLALSSQEELVVDVAIESIERIVSSPEDERQGLLEQEALLQLEQKELLHLQADLRGRVQVEKAEVEKLRAQVALTRNKYNYSCSGFGGDSSDGSSSPLHSDQSDLDDPKMESEITMLKNENIVLQQKKCNLVRCIMEEREACLHLRVQLSLMQLTHESKQL